MQFASGPPYLDFSFQFSLLSSVSDKCGCRCIAIHVRIFSSFTSLLTTPQECQESGHAPAAVWVLVWLNV